MRFSAFLPAACEWNFLGSYVELVFFFFQEYMCEEFGVGERKKKENLL